MSKSKYNGIIERLDAQIDALVYELYRLTREEIDLVEKGK